MTKTAGAVTDSRPLKLLVVTNEIPSPPLHGGRVDVLRRLHALQQHGVQVEMLLTWCSEGELPDDRAVDDLAKALPSKHLDVIEISRSWAARIKRLPRLVKESLQVSARQAPRGKVAEWTARAQQCGVELVLADGLFAGPLARELARRLAVPLVYRSHNIEHLYLQRQARLARGPRAWLSHRLSAHRVEELERDLLKEARLVLDISQDDMAFWRGQGYQNLRWLPPYCPPLPPARSSIAPHDVAFLGNLFMPNNVEGLLWFTGTVWPKVLAARPGSSLLIAGSRPSAAVSALSRLEGVTVLADVANVTDVYASARVLINPVRQGSGVNMKSLELLDTGKPVISTSQGVKGLPAEHAALFAVTDDDEEFAARLLALLDSSDADPAQQRSRLPSCYRPEAAAELVQWLRGVAGRRELKA